MCKACDVLVRVDQGRGQEVNWSELTEQFGAPAVLAAIAVASGRVDDPRANHHGRVVDAIDGAYSKSVRIFGSLSRVERDARHLQEGARRDLARIEQQMREEVADDGHGGMSVPDYLSDLRSGKPSRKGNNMLGLVNRWYEAQSRLLTAQNNYLATMSP